MSLIIKKRGRPTKEMVAARSAAVEEVHRSDDEILVDLKERFRVLGIITEGTVQQNVRAATVTGAPGVGKTYTMPMASSMMKMRSTFSRRCAIAPRFAVSIGSRNRKPLRTTMYHRALNSTDH